MGLLLLVEDSDIDADAIERLLPDDYDVVRAKSLKEAMSMLKGLRNELHLIILDLALPDSEGGAATFIPMCEQDLSIPVIVLTGTVADDDLVVRAVSSGIDDYLSKDVLTESSIKQAIGKAVTRKQKQVMLRTLNIEQLAVMQELAEKVFQTWIDSSRMQLKLIDQMSGGDSSIEQITAGQNKLLEYFTQVLTELHGAINPKIDDSDRSQLLRRVLDAIERGKD
jgi:CheY-like chemotaxis protein